MIKKTADHVPNDLITYCRSPYMNKKVKNLEKLTGGLKLEV